MKVKFAFKGATPSRKRKDKCDFQVPDGEDEISFSSRNKYIFYLHWNDC